MTLNNNTRLILGIVLAAGIGMAIAMLLAPEKTNEFRKKVSSSLDDLGQKVADLLEEGKQQLQQKGQWSDTGSPNVAVKTGQKAQA